MSNYCSLSVSVSEVSVATTGRGCDPVSRDPWYSQTRAWAFLQNRGDDLPLPLLHVVIAINMVVHYCTYSIPCRENGVNWPFFLQNDVSQN